MFGGYFHRVCAALARQQLIAGLFFVSLVFNAK
jgi:hypothetical protein